MKVSQSKVKAWRGCKRQAHNKYVLKLRKNRVSRPLQFGRIVHEMIEAHADGKDPFQILKDIDIKNAKMFSAEKDMYGELIEDIEIIMEDYFEYWSDDRLTYLEINKKKSEHVFAIDVGQGLIFTGKIDGKVRTKNKLNWLAEHKSGKRMLSEDERWRNLQSAVYVRANDIMGWKPVDGTLWDYINSKSPTRPSINQDGTLSRKKIMTLPGAIIATLRQHGKSRKEYRSLIKSAEVNRVNYFARMFTPLNKVVVDMVWEDFIESAKDIADNLGTQKTRNIGKHCAWCDYEGLCRTELTNGDVDFVIEREYRYEENKDEGVAEREEELEGDA